jgi:plastocyanin
MRSSMKSMVGLVVLTLAGATSALAGGIVGTIRGVPPAAAAPAAPGGGAYESRRYKYVEKIDYDNLHDFVVYLDQPVAGANAAPPALATVTTTQRDANFDPHVLVVAAGTTVRWPNEDDIFHNVFSMSEAKQFDLGYYKKEKTPEIVFERAGVVDVFCAIHTRMHCVVVVTPNRFFAKADDRGHFTISAVPAGTYKLKAWHERLPAKTVDVVVPAEGEVKLALTLSLGDLPKY